MRAELTRAMPVKPSSPPRATRTHLRLMRKLLVVHRLLEAEERLTKREPRR
jgi:hypothetical protein